MQKTKAFPVLVLFLLCLFFTTPVSAKNMGNMKGVTWDLKLKKPVTYYTYVGGAGFIKQKATLTSMKLTPSSKPGYVLGTFTVKFTRQT